MRDQVWSSLDSFIGPIAKGPLRSRVLFLVPWQPLSSNRVAVIGASGYGGLQTLRLLQDHPQFSVTFLGGERSSGRRWSELVPFLPLSQGSGGSPP
jgi:hypothetical protein